LTTAYQHGEFRKTAITMTADDAQRTVQDTIGGGTGNFPGALKRRAWVLRIHRPEGWPENFVPTSAKMNNKNIGGFRLLARNGSAMPFGDSTGAPDGDVFELKLPAASVTTEQQVEILFKPAH
jgi:hypothetical protein